MSKWLNNLQHVNRQTLLELGGFAVLVLLVIVLAVVLLRRLRKRGGTTAVEDQPIDLSMRLGKLIDGMSPQPEPTPAVAAPSAGASGEAIIPQTALLGVGGTAPLGTAPLGSEDGAASLAAWTRSDIAETELPAAGSALAGVATLERLRRGPGHGSGPLVLHGAERFDYRALASVWEPVLADGNGTGTRVLTVPESATGWDTAPLPLHGRRADAFPEAGQAQGQGGSRQRLDATPLATPTTDLSFETLLAPPEPATLDTPTTRLSGLPVKTFLEKPVADWDAYEPVPAPGGGSEPDASEAAGWDRLDGPDVSTPAPPADAEADEPAEDHEETASWTMRLSMLTPLKAAMPLAPVQPPEVPEEAPAPSASNGTWEHPNQDLEGLSAFPVTVPDGEAWPPTADEPSSPQDEPPVDGDGWEPVEWPAQPATTPAAAFPLPDLAPPPAASTPPAPVAPAPRANTAPSVAFAPPPRQERTPIAARTAATGTGPLPPLQVTPALADALEAYLGEVSALPDVVRGALIRRDGSLIAGSLQAGAGAGQVPAPLAAALAASARGTKLADLGAFGGLTLVGRDGLLLVIECGPLAMLAILTAKDARLGSLRRSLRRPATSLKELLAASYVS